MNVERRFAETESPDQREVDQTDTRMEQHDPRNRSDHAWDDGRDDGYHVREVTERSVCTLYQPGHHKREEKGKEGAAGSKYQAIRDERVERGIKIGFRKVFES